MKKLVVLSGAGISAESGIKTFRDADGLWEGHDVMEVATPEGFEKNPELVLDFYNQRRRQLKEVSPNHAHRMLADLEDSFNVVIITQNVDDLHERAGSTKVLHLHGELLKARSVIDRGYVKKWADDLNLGDVNPKGEQMRPHIVWFGEDVPMMMEAAPEVSSADIILVVGTSMQVYPAAGLVGLAPLDADIFYIDPNPKINYELSTSNNLTVIEESATKGIDIFIEKIA